MALFGQEQRLTLLVFNQFVCAHCLAKSRIQYEQIVFSVWFCGFFKLSVKAFAFCKHFVLVYSCVFDCVENCFAFVEIVALQPISEVENGNGIIESDGKGTRERFGSIFTLVVS